MLRYGYLSEQVPDCFSSASFGAHTRPVLELVRRSISCAPVSLSTYKRDASRRTIAIPNPYAYASTVKLMGDCWKMIRHHARSDNSLSKIVYCRSYHSGLAEAINNERTRLHYKSKSGLLRNAKICMASALGFRYRLKIDISTCYDSLHPRTLLWALFGKAQAETFIAAQPPECKRSLFDFANQLAKSISHQNNASTSGILTGPYTSRIFSEIVLACIDRDLGRTLGKRFFFDFRRYVDDYRFYFKTEPELQQALTEIEGVLGVYGFKLNHSKTVVDIYPFDTIGPMRRRYEQAYEEAGMCGLLNEATMMHKEGSRGAFKYALKMARSRVIDPNDAEAVLGMLFNIHLVSPESARYVAPVVEANRESFQTERLSEVICEQIDEDLKRGFDQEALNSLYFAKRLGLPITARCLLEVLRQGCDLAVIIALDLWRNHRDRIQPTPYETRLVNAQRREIEHAMEGASMDGEHWMLLYEAHRHKLLRSVDITTGATARFFAALDEMDVDFYLP